MTNLQKKNNKGFTILELMAVIVIIGLLSAAVSYKFMGAIDKAKVTKTKADLKSLHNAVLQFKMDTGRYPTAEEGLSVLVEDPGDVEGYSSDGYLETTSIPKDAWKHEYYYQEYPESGKPFVIISWGADGEEGGEGYDQDLYSTDAE